MSVYIYKCFILTDATSSVGFDTAAEAANKSDFETNFKAQTYPVTDIEVLGTAFIIDKTYAQFKTLIDGATITWSDVKLKVNGNHYTLYLLTDTPL